MSRSCCEFDNAPVNPGATERLERLAKLARALCDPTRLAILEMLVTKREPLCVCNITERLPVSQPTVSHHLCILREAGLVVTERRGTWAYYEATELGRAALHALSHLTPEPATR